MLAIKEHEHRQERGWTSRTAESEVQSRTSGTEVGRKRERTLRNLSSQKPQYVMEISASLYVGITQAYSFSPRLFIKITALGDRIYCNGWHLYADEGENTRWD